MTTEHAKAPEKAAAEIIEKAEHGKELTPAEQRAYDKAMAAANEAQGYEPFAWHGRTLYRILESPSHTFDSERDAVAFVTAMRVTRNLTEV